jgi:hypothetical protein
MAHALEIFLDGEADAAVRGLWDRLERVGLASLRTASHGRHHRHVTLAVGEHIAVGDGLIDALEALPGQRLSFPVLGVFPGDAAVLLLGAQVAPALLDAHAGVHAAIDRKSGNGGGIDGPSEVDRSGALYKPGSWVPHCTLAMRLDAESLARALRELHPYAGLRAGIRKVGLVDTETGDVQDLVGGP